MRCVDDGDADAHEREAEEDAGRDGVTEEEVADDDADDRGGESENGESAGRMALQQAGDQNEAKARDDKSLIKNGA